MSEMKRAGRALVESRTERFESLFPLDQSRARLERAMARTRLVAGAQFVPRWREEGGKAVLEATFLPPRGIHGLLRGISLLLVVLIGTSIYEIVSTSTGALRYLVPGFTIACILGLPLLTLALNSQREAHESRIRRAIREALLDADPAFPPPHRWSDED